MALPTVAFDVAHHEIFNLSTGLKVLRRKLSANGQDLGSASLFGVRLGFSGTPSDLLPVDFGVAQYQRGDDAQMLSVLTSPEVVSYTFAPANWTVLGVLSTVAAAQPPPPATQRAFTNACTHTRSA